MIPENYDGILGVTGTLEKLNDQMLGKLKSHNLNVLTKAPSIFGQSQVTFSNKD